MIILAQVLARGDDWQPHSQEEHEGVLRRYYDRSAQA